MREAGASSAAHNQALLLELFAAAGASAGAKLKLWYVCPEFGLRVPVDFREAAPPPARKN